jgi:hypothetical protein
MPAHQAWKTIRLWTELATRPGDEANAVRASLERWMRDISSVLASGGSSPTDFTLHDAEHSERVAERMVELLPANVLGALSVYELALLLLSAYLHDIGMTPEVEKVRRNRDFLLTGKDDLLADDEVKAFQYWLDAAGYGITPPMDTTRPLDEVNRQADEIITYYTRDRHNDWSEAWIRAHLDGQPLGAYDGWMTDLVRLCRSHHEGYDVLAGRDFDPRRVGSPAQVVHLRYLAALLRVADVLDVDRERTPEVIFHHRDIAPTSATYWQKDAHLVLHLEDGQISATARPPRAYLHKAVEETIDGIERELALCRRLADATRFEKPIGPGADLPHRWAVKPNVFRDVEPRDGAYQYIDGAFRPNTRRLLELLSGTALYGDPLAAVRELLQNAFDAVRELIAYRRLRLPNSSDPGLETRLGELLWVRLSLEQQGDRLWLVCRDDGIGMTREIIRNALLVSGSPIRPQVLDLERECRAKGFALGRTGQFGVGALSYFMLADQVQLRTRRANEAGDAEPNGWAFESHGIGSFGELRKDSALTQGTELRLRLRAEVARDSDEFPVRLLEFVRRTLIHIPCNFIVEGGGNSSILQPGWTVRETERTATLLAHLNESGKAEHSKRVPSRRHLNRLHRETARWKKLCDYAKHVLRWATEEGELPDNAGRYRLHLPYLEVPGGAALALIRPRADHGRLVLRKIGTGNYLKLYEKTDWAWKGMSIQILEEGRAKPSSDWERALEILTGNIGLTPWHSAGVSADIDFSSSALGELSVSRGRLELAPAGMHIVKWVEDRAQRFVKNFIKDHAQSRFALLNARLSGVNPPEGIRYEWGIDDQMQKPAGRAVSWGELPFPLVQLVPRRGLEFWAGKQVNFVLPFAEYSESDTVTDNKLTWYGEETPPQRVVALKNAVFPHLLAPLWTSPPHPDAATVASTLGWVVEFPPEWSHICGAGIGTFSDAEQVWNVAHPLVQLALTSTIPRKHVMSTEPDMFREQLEALLASRSGAAAWLLEQINRAGARELNDLRDLMPNFFPRLWEALFPDPEQQPSGKWTEVFFYIQDSLQPKLLIVSPLGAQVVSSTSKEFPGLPLPNDSAWVIGEAISYNRRF